jgi:hypothetical protein
VEDLGDERQASAPVLARLDELLDLFAKLRSGVIANQSTGAVEDLAVAQIVDFGFDFFNTTPQTRGEP